MNRWTIVLLLAVGIALVGCVIIIVAKPNSTVALDWGLPLNITGPSVETHSPSERK